MISQVAQYAMAEKLQKLDLKEWERNFIESVVNLLEHGRSLSQKQYAKLIELDERYFTDTEIHEEDDGEID